MTLKLSQDMRRSFGNRSPFESSWRQQSSGGQNKLSWGDKHMAPASDHLAIMEKICARRRSATTCQYGDSNDIDRECCLSTQFDIAAEEIIPVSSKSSSEQNSRKYLRVMKGHTSSAGESCTTEALKPSRLSKSGRFSSSLCHTSCPDFSGARLPPVKTASGGTSDNSADRLDYEDCIDAIEGAPVAISGYRRLSASRSFGSAPRSLDRRATLRFLKNSPSRSLSFGSHKLATTSSLDDADGIPIPAQAQDLKMAMKKYRDAKVFEDLQSSDSVLGSSPPSGGSSRSSTDESRLPNFVTQGRRRLQPLTQSGIATQANSRPCDSSADGNTSESKPSEQPNRKLLRSRRISVTFITPHDSEDRDGSLSPQQSRPTSAKFRIVPESGCDLGIEDPRQDMADLESVFDGFFSGESQPSKARWEMEAEIMAQEEEERRRLRAESAQQAMLARQMQIDQEAAEVKLQQETAEQEKRMQEYNSIRNVATRLLKRIDKGQSKRLTPTQDSLELEINDIEGMTRDVQIERRLEAVFTSYSLYGEWRADEAAMWLPTTCKGMSGSRFLDLVRDTNLMPDARWNNGIQEVFSKHSNTETGFLDFPGFLLAISDLAVQAMKKPFQGVIAVLRLNKEGYILLH